MLKASSLLESVIAIVVIAVCMLIAVQVYAALLQDSPSVAHYKAKFRIQELIAKTRKDQDFEEELFDYGTFKILKKVEDYQEQHSKKVTFLSIFAKDTMRTDILIKNSQPDE